MIAKYSGFRSPFAFLLVMFALASPAAAQKDDAKEAYKAPSADDVKATLEKFQVERSEAIEKAKFPASALSPSDESIRRAEAALKAGDVRSAARHARDARWQIPYLPPGLPPHVIRILGESRMRHSERVNAIAYSPDGGKLATASKDGLAKIWDLANGRELATYRGHPEIPATAKAKADVFWVADIAFSPDGKTVASVGPNEIHIWDPANGKQIQVINRTENADKPFKCLAFSPDGKQIAAGSDDNILRVYDIAKPEKPTFASPPQAGRIEGVAFASNGKLVATVNNAGQLTVYAPGAANPLAMAVPVSDSGAAFDVSFTADSGALLTVGNDAKARLTAGPKEDGSSAGNTATRLREFAGHTQAVKSLAVSHDGTVLVTGSDDKTVRVWEVTSAKPLRSFQGHMAEVTAVAIRPDGRQVASASFDGTIRLWDLNTSDDHRAMTDAADSVWAIAFSPNGKRVAAAGADKTVRVYDPASGKLEKALPAQPAAITSLAFLDNDRLAAAGGDKIITIWDVPAGKPAKQMTGHDSAVLALAVSPDGKLLVSGAADRTVRGWDPDAGTQLWSWTGKSAVCSVAVRKGNKIVAVGSADGGLVMLDLGMTSPKEISSQTAHLAGVSGLAFDPDGNRLATCGGDGTIRVWTVAENGGLATLMKFEGSVKPGTTSGYSPVTAVAFSPDGRFLASAGADQIVHVWDVQTKNEVRGLRGHGDWVTAVAFSPDGHFLASAGADKAARVFELTQQDMAPPPGHTQKARAVAVSPNGKLAATASEDKTIKVWDLAEGREVATLLGAVERIYTISFVGNDKLVTGGDLSAGAGRVQFWQIKPPKAGKGTVTGPTYNVVGAMDGSKAAAWTARPAVGDQANPAYETFDGEGNSIGSLADRGRDVSSASFSPDLAWVLSGDKQGSIRVWNLATKERVGDDWPLFVQAVADLAISPDKKTLAAIDVGGLVKVADVGKRETLGSVQAHKNGITGLMMSPKGDTFVTIGTDKEVKAWSIDGVKELRTWKCPVEIWGAAYTPDGKRLVTANGDGTAYVLELP